MVYKQITERGRKKQRRNKEMKTERNWPASDTVSGLAAFWIIALALPSTQNEHSRSTWFTPSARRYLVVFMPTLNRILPL